MSEWLLSLRGTEAGNQLAMVLALQAAFLHAVLARCRKAGMTHGLPGGRSMRVAA